MAEKKKKNQNQNRLVCACRNLEIWTEKTYCDGTSYGSVIPGYSTYIFIKIKTFLFL